MENEIVKKYAIFIVYLIFFIKKALSSLRWAFIPNNDGVLDSKLKRKNLISPSFGDLDTLVFN